MNASASGSGTLAYGLVADALATVLERRYLENLDPARFRLVAEDDDAAVPVLREVLALGRAAKEELGKASMMYALAACHKPGHDLCVVLFGDGTRHRLLYGLRRRTGGHSFEGAMAGMEGALRAQMPGLELSAAKPLRVEAESTLVQFLTRANCIASITGIPSLRQRPGESSRQGLDQVVAAMGSRRYALLLVAEALPINIVEDAMSSCRALLSELHPHIASSVGQSRTETLGRSEQHVSGMDSPGAQIGPALVKTLAFSAGAGAALPLLSLAASSLGSPTPRDVPESSGRSWSEAKADSKTLSMLDADARYCSQLIERHHERLCGARGLGWWRTAVYFAAEDEAALSCATQTLRSVAVGDATQLEPIRIQRPPTHLLRDAMLHGRLLRLQGVGGNRVHPLGTAHEALATCISSDELAALIQPPRSEVPGIAQRDPGHFSLSVPVPDSFAVRLGDLCDDTGRTLGPVGISARALNEHVLVVGTPGSGKTNTCMRLLIETHQRLGIPFLVIEPAKAEYRRLALEPSLREKLRVYSVGSQEGSPLRLNPLRPVPGVSLLGHIDLLKAVFNASFAMFPGMPQILEQALIEVYEQRGWNLYTSENDAVAPSRSKAEEEEALLPSLSDLHDQVESVLRRRNYGEEVRRNLGAALTSRLNSLRVGNKGLILDTRRSTPLAELFECPVVLELSNLRDDEEKSFVMALVLALLSQYCEARQALYPDKRHEELQHVTLVEEAHRLLAAAPRAAADAADARGKGVAIFTDMLAELRALGEGFIVAEQIPTKLAPDVLKNTNLKIIHRLTAPSDCAVIGDSVNLSAPQLRYLVALPMGTAVVHGLTARPGAPVADAVLVRIASVKDDLKRADTAVSSHAPPPPNRGALFRLGGCEACASPCEFYPKMQRALRAVRGDSAFRAVAEAVLGSEDHTLTAAFCQWRSDCGAESWSRGGLHCAFIHAAAKWLQTVFAARGTMDDANGLRVTRPVDLLEAHRLSKAFGHLARALLSDHPEQRQQVAVARQALTASLRQAFSGSGVTAGLAACAACPAPCESLPYVAARGTEQLAAETGGASPRSPKDAFGRSSSIDMRWERIKASLDRSKPTSFHDADLDRMTRAYYYCQIAHLRLPPNSEEWRNDLLARVLADST